MKTLFCLTLITALLAPVVVVAQDQNPVVVMETSHGKIKIELYAKKAPGTVRNFLDYVEAKHYDGLIFHRVIADFMIQGGGFDRDMQQKQTKAAIKNESDNGLLNEKYTIAMARTGEPHSATSQFFINSKHNEFLDKANAKDGWGYCVFGKVIEGQEVVEKIRMVKTATKEVQVGGQKASFEAVPVEAVVIQKVYVQK